MNAAAVGMQVHEAEDEAEMVQYVQHDDPARALFLSHEIMARAEIHVAALSLVRMSQQRDAFSAGRRPVVALGVSRECFL